MRKFFYLAKISRENHDEKQNREKYAHAKAIHHKADRFLKSKKTSNAYDNWCSYTGQFHQSENLFMKDRRVIVPDFRSFPTCPFILGNGLFGTRPWSIFCKVHYRGCRWTDWAELIEMNFDPSHKTRQQHVTTKHLNCPAVIVMSPPPTEEPGGSLVLPTMLVIFLSFGWHKSAAWTI